MTGLGRLDPPAKAAPKDTRCPKCKAGPDKRVHSSLAVIDPDLCGVCGYEFKESA